MLGDLLGRRIWHRQLRKCSRWTLQKRKQPGLSGFERSKRRIRGLGTTSTQCEWRGRGRRVLDRPRRTRRTYEQQRTRDRWLGGAGRRPDYSSCVFV